MSKYVKREIEVRNVEGKLSFHDLVALQEKVEKWSNYGYTEMAILYFVHSEGFSVSGFLEGDTFVINVYKD